MASSNTVAVAGEEPLQGQRCDRSFERVEALDLRCCHQALPTSKLRAAPKCSTKCPERTGGTQKLRHSAVARMSESASRVGRAARSPLQTRLKCPMCPVPADRINISAGFCRGERNHRTHRTTWTRTESGMPEDPLVAKAHGIAEATWQRQLRLPVNPLIVSGSGQSSKRGGVGRALRTPSPAGSPLC